MTRQEIRELYISKIKKECKQRGSGGQTVGLVSRTVTLTLEDLDIEVKVGYYRSQFQNYDAAKLVMEMLIDDYLDEMRL
jgi:protein subunit release factor B